MNFLSLTPNKFKNNKKVWTKNKIGKMAKGKEKCNKPLNSAKGISLIEGILKLWKGLQEEGVIQLNQTLLFKKI